MERFGALAHVLVELLVYKTHTGLQVDKSKLSAPPPKLVGTLKTSTQLLSKGIVFVPTCIVLLLKAQTKVDDKLYFSNMYLQCTHRHIQITQVS